MKVALLLCLGLAGCEQWQDAIKNRKPISVIIPYNETCIDGVKYVLIDRGASVKFQPDGKVTPCGGEAR